MRNTRHTVTKKLIRKLQKSQRRVPAWKASVCYLLERDGPACTLCGEEFSTTKGISIDHVIPISRGGRDRLENFQLAHRGCNSRKGSETSKYGSKPGVLVRAGIMPAGLDSKTSEYRALYVAAREAMLVRWWAAHQHLAYWSGARFSIREWTFIQTRVHARVWYLRVHEGEEAAMSYEPTRAEFSKKRSKR